MSDSAFEGILDRVEEVVAQGHITGSQMKLLVHAMQWELALGALTNHNIELKPVTHQTTVWQVPDFRVRIEQTALTAGLCDLRIALYTDIAEARQYLRAQGRWDMADMMDYLSFPEVIVPMYQPPSYVFTLCYELQYGVYSLRQGFRAEKCLELQTA
jgi:hypothetical protein